MLDDVVSLELYKRGVAAPEKRVFMGWPDSRRRREGKKERRRVGEGNFDGCDGTGKRCIVLEAVEMLGNNVYAKTRSFTNPSNALYALWKKQESIESLSFKICKTRDLSNHILTMEKRGNMVPRSPSHTPRSSDKAVRDIRPEVQMNGKHDREKGVNVQVIVRCSSAASPLRSISVNSERGAKKMAGGDEGFSVVLEVIPSMLKFFMTPSTYYTWENKIRIISHMMEKLQTLLDSVSIKHF
ncbi:unnamed protein product [Lactuca saligna]|uniref:Uncharacterized protein n=1 Tax=Lactuca saligna TaxID=75948 RepID=A0AA35Y3W5_LACSI|nr:unnamed protein product [Lactuca saligna]